MDNEQYLFDEDFLQRFSTLLAQKINQDFVSREEYDTITKKVENLEKSIEEYQNTISEYQTAIYDTSY